MVCGGTLGHVPVAPVEVDHCHGVPELLQQLRGRQRRLLTGHAHIMTPGCSSRGGSGAAGTHRPDVRRPRFVTKPSLRAPRRSCRQVLTALSPVAGRAPSMPRRTPGARWTPAAAHAELPPSQLTRARQELSARATPTAARSCAVSGSGAAAGAPPAALPSCTPTAPRHIPAPQRLELAAPCWPTVRRCFTAASMVRGVNVTRGGTRSRRRRVAIEEVPTMTNTLDHFQLPTELEREPDPAARPIQGPGRPGSPRGAGAVRGRRPRRRSQGPPERTVRGAGDSRSVEPRACFLTRPGTAISR
jgi:hypothetical protein